MLKHHRPRRAGLRLEALEDRCVPANLVGLTSDNHLDIFNTDVPGFLFSTLTITGLQTNESVVGLDYRLDNGTLFALGVTPGANQTATGNLYTISPTTGKATLFEPLERNGAPVQLNGTSFNLTDEPTAHEIVIQSNSGQLIQVDPNDGTVLAFANGAAYSKSDVSAGVTPDLLAIGAGQKLNQANKSQFSLFALDAATNNLVSESATTGGPGGLQNVTLNTIGPVGFGLGTVAAMDVVPSTTGNDVQAFAALNLTGSVASQLASIDLTTGAATLLGPIAGSTLRALSVAPAKFALGQPVTSVTPGNGQMDLVKVFNADGTERFEFTPYASGFRGGVRVASGDVTGDGVPDIVTAPGSGTGQDVQVYDGTNGKMVAQFSPFVKGVGGGVFVAVADVTGDKVADIITGAGSGGTPLVQAFSLAPATTTTPTPPTTPPTGQPALSTNGLLAKLGLLKVVTTPNLPFTSSVVRSFNGFDASFTGGVTVAAADLNGDTVADIIVGAASKGAPQVRAFSGIDTSQLLSNFYAFDQKFTGGVYVAAGDVNGDGQNEIIVGAGKGSSPEVKTFNVFSQQLSDFFAFDGSFTGGVRVSSAPDPTTGRDDIVAGSGSYRAKFTPPGQPKPPAPQQVVFFDGTTLQALTSYNPFPNYTGGVYVG
jgi:hypothetical protein